jgi:hypothetical protein
MTKARMTEGKTLMGVTISGADDAVDPANLADLSREFPFVEWGIMFSATRAGTPRYPSTDWLHDLCSSEYVHKAPGLKLSAHFCGQCMRDTVDGNSRWLLRPHMRHFRRVQLNRFEWPLGSGFGVVLKQSPHEFILQVRDERGLVLAADKATEFGVDRVSALYDPSGGRGIESLTWPTSPDVDGFRVGYAGGLGPDNVEEALVARVPMTAEAYWVDMESGVRTGQPETTTDAFDLGKVREVLVRAKPFVWSG